MRSVSVRLADLNKVTIPIGFVGENLHTQVRIDCVKLFEDYPNAVPGLTVNPPMGDTYPAVVTRDGDYVIWDIEDSDLTVNGNGEIQLSFFVDEVIAKSYISRIRIEKSLVSTGDVPTPIENWIDEANEKLAEVEQWNNVTAEASTLAPGTSATVEITEENGHNKFEFGIPRGDKGDTGTPGFSPVIVVTDITGGHRVSITDVGGTQTVDIMDGEKGDTGNGIESAVLNQDYTLTLNFTDGTHYTTPSIRGAKGETGDTGNGIASVTLNQDYTLTITYTNGQSTTTASIRGEKGETGATPVITIGTVTTLQPGSDATASMDVTDPEHPVLSFGIPEGEPGDATIDDTSTANNRVWSAQKTNELKSALDASGVLYDIPILTGKYYGGSVGNQYTLSTNANSIYIEPVDVSSLKGSKIKVLLSAFDSSSRETGFCNSSGVISRVWSAGDTSKWVQRSDGWYEGEFVVTDDRFFFSYYWNRRVCFSVSEVPAIKNYEEKTRYLVTEQIRDSESENLLDPLKIYAGVLGNSYVVHKQDAIVFDGNYGSSSSTGDGEAIPLVPGETYTAKVHTKSGKLISGYIRTYSANGSTLQTISVPDVNVGVTFTVNQNATKVVWNFGFYSGVTYDNDEYYLMINKGETAKPYQRYWSAVDSVFRIEADGRFEDEYNVFAKALNSGHCDDKKQIDLLQGYIHGQNYDVPARSNVTVYSQLFKNVGSLKISVEDGYKALIVNGNTNKQMSSWSSWLTGEAEYTPTSEYWCLEIRNTAETDINPTSASNKVVVYQIIGEAFSSGGNLVAYVSTTGNDSNDGASRSTPFATIQKAIDSGASVVLVKEGTYANGFSLSGKNGVSIIIDHYYDSYTIVTDEDNPKIVIDGNTNSLQTGVTITGCTNCHFGNIEVKRCSVSGFTVKKSDSIRFDDCIAHDIGVGAQSGAPCGFGIESTNADFYNCQAYNIGTNQAGTGAYHNDGFNIHYTGTTNFINCKAWNCEDDGISHHDACCGFVDGGEWYNCGKGGIATPTHGAKVNISNVYCHHNAYGIYAGNSNAVTDRGNIIISNAVLKNNTTKDIRVDDYYKVIAINCVYDTVEGAANISRFGYGSN